MGLDPLPQPPLDPPMKTNLACLPVLFYKNVFAFCENRNVDLKIDENRCEQKI